MAKRQSIKERFMSDGDILSPKHDDLMIALDRNVEKILSVFWEKRHFNQPTKPKLEMEISKEWESPVVKEDHGKGYCNRTVIGFVDLNVKVRWPYPHKTFMPEGSVEWSDTEDSFLFEVKTSIPSLGELIRQINYYQENRGRNYEIYVVFSPDSRFKQILMEQGISYINSDDYR